MVCCLGLVRRHVVSGGKFWIQLLRATSNGGGVVGVPLGIDGLFIITKLSLENPKDAIHTRLSAAPPHGVVGILGHVALVESLLRP